VTPQEIVNALGAFPILQTGAVVLIGAGMAIAWWRANITLKKNNADHGDANRPATLYDLQLMRSEMQAAVSERHERFYRRFERLDSRLTRAEGRLGIWGASEGLAEIDEPQG